MGSAGSFPVGRPHRSGRRRADRAADGSARRHPLRPYAIGHGTGRFGQPAAGGGPDGQSGPRRSRLPGSARAEERHPGPGPEPLGFAARRAWRLHHRGRRRRGRHHHHGEAQRAWVRARVFRRARHDRGRVRRPAPGRADDLPGPCALLRCGRAGQRDYLQPDRGRIPDGAGHRRGPVGREWVLCHGDRHRGGPGHHRRALAQMASQPGHQPAARSWEGRAASGSAARTRPARQLYPESVPSAGGRRPARPRDETDRWG